MQSPRNTESFITSGRSLEDAFFLSNDRQLLEHRAKLHKMQTTREALAEVSGIRDQDVLDQLVRLGVTPETLAAVAVVPLVEVAWANGHVDDKERAVVLEHARTLGVSPGTVEHGLIEHWLNRRPDDALLVAWQHYIEALCVRLDSAQREHLKKELLGGVQAAASASGGILGIGAVSREEKEAIAKLEASFCG